MTLYTIGDQKWLFRIIYNAGALLFITLHILFWGLNRYAAAADDDDGLYPRWYTGDAIPSYTNSKAVLMVSL